ncbi:penicillin-insensitive murein endopeptidase [Archangium violaceum]|uniref:penicillin-insensitive murein endopeptidase n=1 Tax=Archangium violaceum TaxID=83451 RepID=UPI00193BB78A|nr:penicillin-insensitive murein endopeptidase [Archangium violaceum]QRK06485.1 penicillin-insensitive murein endopeptidase [Archangium violaceum]
MRSTSWIILWLCAGCTAHVVPTIASSNVAAPSLEASASPGSAAGQPDTAPSQENGASQPPVLPERVTQVVEHNDAALQASVGAADSGDDEGEEDEPADASDADEGEAQEAQATTGEAPTGPLYTAELSDEQLTEMWKKDPASLGSISVGFVESGRMVNAERFPEGDDWIVVSPELAWGTRETLDYIAKAIREVRAAYPKAPPLRVNQLSSREGGYLRPHKSHQNGRDVDLGFYYPTAEPIRVRAREKHIDLELNWALIKALAVHTDVQMILVDKRVQKVLYEYALRKGENKEWLDSLFHAGSKSLIKHARGHRDHFHVRFYNPRAQELGRRIAPLLALQPDKNIQMHRVRSGDTLGAIALRYGSSVQSIKKANRMRSTFLRLGQVLAVPLRGPCTRCPVPPPLVVPPRRMPPELVEQAPAVATKQTPQAAPASAAPAPVPEQTAEVTLQAPAAATPPPSSEQPAVAAQPENTGGSAPASTPGTKPGVPETPREVPSGVSLPAVTHTSASILPVMPSLTR